MLDNWGYRHTLGMCNIYCFSTAKMVTWTRPSGIARSSFWPVVCNSYSENPNKMQECISILLILILNEAQHVSGDTPPIIRSIKLHRQPLVLHTWKVVGRAVVGRCQVAYATQHVSCDTPPIIRSIKLHRQPLVLHTWKVVGRAVVGRCQVAYA